MTDAKTDIKSEEKKSKYWKFTLLKDEEKTNWKSMLGLKGKGFVGKLIDDEPNQAYKTACQEAGYKIRKIKAKYCKPAYRKGIIVFSKSKTLAEVNEILKTAGAKNPELINDTAPYDKKLKTAIKKLIPGVLFKTLLKQTETFGGLNWEDEANKTVDLVPGERQPLNFYRYARPKMFSKTQIVNQCYWTNKCLDYLPGPDDEYDNDTYKFSYDVWSSDTILRMENKYPEVMKKAKRKYERQNNPTEAAKMAKRVEKAKKTKQAHKKKQQEEAIKQWEKEKKDMIKEFNDGLKSCSVGLSNEQANLSQACFKMTTLNHLAKYLGDWDREYEDGTALYQKLTSIYSVNKIYKLKNRFLDLLYVLNPSGMQLTLYDPRHFGDSLYGNLDFKDLSADYNYYACYNFAIDFKNGFSYDYHLPYPIGCNKYPIIPALHAIDQIPNGDGPYMFGEEADYAEQDYAANHDLLADLSDWIDQQMNSNNIDNLQSAVHKRTKNYNDIQTNYFKYQREKAIAKKERKRKRRENKKKAIQKAQAKYFSDENYPDFLTELLKASIHKVFEVINNNPYQRKYFKPTLDIHNTALLLSQKDLKKQFKAMKLSDVDRQAIIKVVRATAYCNMLQQIYQVCYKNSMGTTTLADIPRTVNSFNFKSTDLFKTEIKSDTNNNQTN